MPVRPAAHPPGRATLMLRPPLRSAVMLPYFRERKKGSIINVTSIAARYWSANQGSYCASKAALEAYTCSLAQEVQKFGVQVSSLQCVSTCVSSSCF